MRKIDMESHIATVQDIRRVNNQLWMDILRLAMNHAPHQTRAVLREINKNDSAINHQLRILADAD